MFNLTNRNIQYVSTIYHSGRGEANAIVVGWTGAYPVLCRKRPTANLVSRKVLIPLLGQIAICILIQAVGFQAVRRQPWYVVLSVIYRNLKSKY